MHTARIHGQRGRGRTQESPLTLPITGRGDAEPQRPSFFCSGAARHMTPTVIQPNVVITYVFTESMNHPYSKSPRLRVSARGSRVSRISRSRGGGS